MVRLEQLAAGARVTGIEGDEPVTIVAVRACGQTAAEITYKDSRERVANQLLDAEAIAALKLAESSLPWSFTADSAKLRLASEAYRIRLAHLFDPYLAVHTSAIEPLPHQISAVYETMLPQQTLRFVLADDPGAGKTIMTGLLLKEFIIRGEVKRCLIVCPGNLAEQWMEELYQKFHLKFQLLTNELLESAASGNAFLETPFCIARLDKLSRNQRILEKLEASQWDLIVCDEAHKMSASYSGGETKETKRYKLGKLLSTITRHFLLLTATPHNGKEEDFQLFLSLIDPDRFEGVRKGTKQAADVSGIMRRLVKEDLLRFDGTPLFPERIAYTLNYDLSGPEKQLYEDVTSYIRQEFNRADKLKGDRRASVGFALTILQRRLASSPEAIYQSLKRRRERLEGRLSEERLNFTGDEKLLPEGQREDWNDLPASEVEAQEDAIADQASAASSAAELEREIVVLKDLERQAGEVRARGTDRKWEELSRLLQSSEKMFTESGQREKLIIFTEHRDTLRYLEGKIASLLGDEQAVVTIHGGISRDDRRMAESLFKNDGEVRVMIATDAAGEGINLQRAHLMVNYDLPWNPNRLEQRFGRIHRIGQTKICCLWNLVADKTREGEVFSRLFTKLEQERQALGGKVFDILGAAFRNKSLEDLLIEAIRRDNDPETQARLQREVDSSLDREKLLTLLAENALTGETLTTEKVLSIKEEMERMEARKLQPHFIESFFAEAFRQLGGTLHPREVGRYSISHVPAVLRQKNSGTEPVSPKYERIYFDKEGLEVPGKPPAVMICPGHPLLEAVIDLTLEQNREALTQGGIYIDENDPGSAPRFLCAIESTVQDGVINPDGRQRVISRQLNFVELLADGGARNAGYAPYLDYRPAKAEETALLLPALQEQAWLQGGLEKQAEDYAIEQILKQTGEVKARRLAQVEKTERAVKERLTAAIQQLDFQAADYQQKAAAGKKNAALNAQNAAHRAEELEARLKTRLAELALEKRISALPPAIISGAVVIPQGMLEQLTGAPSLFSHNPEERKKIEELAMAAVMARERSLGHSPQDVSRENCGYDIESRTNEKSRALRFIEVKGRAKGAFTVTVTRNEILTALNKPEQFILALVEVNGEETAVTYLKRPFHSRPDFAAASVNYDIQKLIAQSEIQHQE